MKLVAKKHFANVPSLALKIDPKTPRYVNEECVHKGHRFEIGTATVFKDLKPADKELVAALMVGGCTVVDDSTPESKADIAKIDAEVKAETEAAARKAAEAPLSVQDQIALGVALALNKLGIEPKK